MKKYHADTAFLDLGDFLEGFTVFFCCFSSGFGICREMSQQLRVALVDEQEEPGVVVRVVGVQALPLVREYEKCP